MITRSEARHMVLQSLFAAALNDDEPAVIQNNVLKRAFWAKYTFNIDAFKHPISFSEATKVRHQAKHIHIQDLAVNDLVDVLLQADDDRYVALTVRRREEGDEPVQAIDNETRFWGQITQINDPFPYFEFASKLYEKSLQKADQLDELIQPHIKNWRLDRLAILDRVILRMAVCELVHFPEIPVKVSINEAIELAKKFSTSQSGRFINGILDVAVNQLQADGHIKKVGRGQL